MLFRSSELAINPSIYSRLPYDPARDFVTVSPVGIMPNLLVVAPSLSARNLQELIAALKARPGSVYASGGTGTISHIAMEMFNAASGVNSVHVPYNGVSPAITAMVRGEVSMMFATLPIVLPHVRDDKLRAIAVAMAKRSMSAPDIPTFAELGIAGMDASYWVGLFAPSGTPSDIINKLNQAVVRALATGDVSARLTQSISMDVVAATPDNGARFLIAEIEKYRAAIGGRIRVD